MELIKLKNTIYRNNNELLKNIEDIDNLFFELGSYYEQLSCIKLLFNDLEKSKKVNTEEAGKTSSSKKDKVEYTVDDLITYGQFLLKICIYQKFHLKDENTEKKKKKKRKSRKEEIEEEEEEEEVEGEEEENEEIEEEEEEDEKSKKKKKNKKIDKNDKKKKKRKIKMKKRIKIRRKKRKKKKRKRKKKKKKRVKKMIQKMYYLYS